MDIRLDGKVAIVTGSSQGIGRAAAVALAEAGAAVVFNSHQNSEEIEQAAETIRSRGGNAKAVVADVTNRQECQELINAASEFTGKIDILVNNAGGLVKRIPVAEFSEDHFQKVVDINLKTAFLMSHLVISHMKEQESGRIIHLSSQAAHDGGGAGSAVYSSTKGGIWTLTKSMAKELGPFGICVNCIAPGFIADTVFHNTFTPKEVHEKVIGSIPLGRHGKSEDVANAVLFLASGLSDYITGQTIEVNGGLYML